jgi:transaldolase
MTQLFIDTADLETIREAFGEGIIRGVTTNPIVIRKEDPGIDVLKRIEDIAAIVPCVSVQLAGPDDRSEQYLEIDEGVIVKMPLEWLPRMPVALDRKRFNLTAILSEEQAAIAVMANPKILSVFWNRSLDAHLSPADVVAFAKKLILEKSFAKSEDDEYDPPEVLVGSIRTVKDVVDAFKADVDIITVPPVILAAMHKHPGTTKFLQECAG